jgi:hypothetical protein
MISSKHLKLDNAAGRSRTKRRQIAAVLIVLSFFFSVLVNLQKNHYLLASETRG